MDIQKQEFDFIDSAEPDMKVIYGGKDKDYVEGRRSLIEIELQMLDLYENKNCVTVTKQDIEKMLDYFNAL